MVSLCERITTLFGSTPAANMVKSYSLNPHWTMITAMFQEKSNTYYISEPIIRKCFPQNVCPFVHFGAVSLIHSALKKKFCGKIVNFTTEFFLRGAGLQ